MGNRVTESLLTSIWDQSVFDDFIKIAIIQLHVFYFKFFATSSLYPQLSEPVSNELLVSKTILAERINILSFLMS